MDVDRIERALREGPPDEPVYVPGSFRRGPASPLGFALAGMAVALAIAIGIVVGTGLASVWDERVGVIPEPRVLSADDLQGVWQSEVIGTQDFIEAHRARGFTQDEIDDFLSHEPVADSVRYTIRFRGGGVTIWGAFGERSPQGLSGGRFRVLDDGTLHYTEVVEGAPAGSAPCEVLATASIEGNRLTFSILELPNCSVDAQIANISFFELSWYTRSDP
jgi:hypothetical protein